MDGIRVGKIYNSVLNIPQISLIFWILIKKRNKVWHEGDVNICELCLSLWDHLSCKVFRKHVNNYALRDWIVVAERNTSSSLSFSPTPAEPDDFLQDSRSVLWSRKYNKIASTSNSAFILRASNSGTFQIISEI